MAVEEGARVCSFGVFETTLMPVMLGDEMVLTQACLFSLFGAVPDPIDIFAAVNITVKLRIADYSSGTYQVVFEDCHFVLVSIDISLLSG